MVGTGLAIGLGLASMGAKAAGGAISAHAAKGAAKDQAAAADKAIGVMDRTYYDQMRGMDPYAQMGAQAANTLTRLTAPGSPYTPGLQRQDARAFAGPPVYRGPYQAPQEPAAASRPRGLAPAVGEAMGRNGSVPSGGLVGRLDPGMQQAVRARLPTVGGGGGYAPSAGGMVTLEGPDGLRRMFSEDEAQQWIDKGAKRVA